TGVQRDIYLKKLDPATVSNDTQKYVEESGFIYNFDFVASAFRSGKIHTLGTIANKIIEHAKKYANSRAVVHTTIIDDSLKDVFQKAGIPLMQKNLDYRSHALSALMPMVQILFRSDKRLKRQYLRFEFTPQDVFLCTIVNKRNENKEVKGFIRDLSLNGIGVTLEDSEQCLSFNLKDPVSVTMSFFNTSVELKLGFMTRLYAIHNELGVSFNVRNAVMIEKDSVDTLQKLINDWVREVELPGEEL
ncbi:MAG: PilZ domain-containing protein, partial [Leptospiraceae bacterium]|nr:PilZ domain-containing protein [Leptospiraceae bacterium]